jgi:hypothetical protein
MEERKAFQKHHPAEGLSPSGLNKRPADIVPFKTEQASCLHRAFPG